MIPADEWDACRVEAVSVKNTQLRPAAAGLDLSAKLDLTAFVIALRVDDPPSDVTPEVVTIEGTDEEGEVVTQELTLNFSVEFIPFFWLPKDTLIGRVRDEPHPVRRLAAGWASPCHRRTGDRPRRHLHHHHEGPREALPDSAPGV